ncbi:MAG: hypothetical protein CBC25_07250 [Pelagibacteraceae bacterium TMED65]|nr:MAG: hypothetical protein CBC25_07250 [Pelagibacteraceae bacterium TMED65]|tara:strand:- start:195 stop:971 length:777 start_codon:yes stop_codon:yes gene_type:complete
MLKLKFFYYKLIINIKNIFYNKFIFHIIHIFFFVLATTLLLVNKINVAEFIFILFLLIYLFFLNLENKSKLTNIPFRKGTPLKFIAIYMQDKIIEGAEIGVYEGDHGEYILNNNYFKESRVKLKKLSLIDPFSEYTDSNGKVFFAGEDGNKFYEKVKKRFSEYKNAELIRKTSEDAAKDFEDETLDFIYIDGDHNYAPFKKDLEIWYQKLKKNGVLCGDDYGIPFSEGIIRGLNEFSFEKKIQFHNVHDSSQWFLIKY